MINSLNGINLNNSCTVNAANKKKTAVTDTVALSKTENISSFTKPAIKISPVAFGEYRIVRTNMSPEEKKIYSKVVSSLPHGQRSQMDYLLRSGI